MMVLDLLSTCIRCRACNSRVYHVRCRAIFIMFCDITWIEIAVSVRQLSVFYLFVIILTGSACRFRYYLGISLLFIVDGIILPRLCFLCYCVLSNACIVFNLCMCSLHTFYVLSCFICLYSVALFSYIFLYLLFLSSLIFLSFYGCHFAPSTYLCKILFENCVTARL